MEKISCIYDNKSVSFSINKNDKSDVIIINETDKTDKHIMKCLNALLDSDSLYLKYEDFYYYFHDFGVWKYDYYSYNKLDLESTIINVKYDNIIIISFIIGNNVTLYDLEEFLEKIQSNNKKLEIVFSCCMDDSVDLNTIQVNIFNKINNG